MWEAALRNAWECFLGAGKLPVAMTGLEMSEAGKSEEKTLDRKGMKRGKGRIR